MNRFDVTALGELLIDFTENGTSAQGNPLLEANPGGAPGAVLAMLAKLGRRTAFIGKVGQDAFGDYLAETLTSCGVDTAGLRRDPVVPTTLAFVHNAPNGERSFSFYRSPGADVTLAEEEIDYSLIDDCRLFHFSTLSMTDPVPRAATQAAAARARAAGKIISFDPNLRPPLWTDLADARQMIDRGIRQCDILKISDDEITFLTGQDTVEEAIPVLLKEYAPKIILVTLGPGGSIALYQGRQIRCEASHMQDTIETTGAGDTFLACSLHYLLEHGLDGLTDEQLTEMLRFAGAAAALITTRRGALKVMPSIEEIQALL